MDWIQFTAAYGVRLIWMPPTPIGLIDITHTQIHARDANDIADTEWLIFSGPQNIIDSRRAYVGVTNVRSDHIQTDLLQTQCKDINNTV